jgi:hypothetical protein
MYRLLLVGTILANKFYEDRLYTNAYYAKVGGIPISELNALEHLFLRYIEFQLTIDLDEYGTYKSSLLE